MRYTFGLFDLSVKDQCLTLINERTSFTVTLVKDDKDQPHYWIIEEKE